MTALICGTIVPAFCGGISAYAEEQTRSFDLPTILVEAEGKVVELPGGLVNETAKMGVFGNKSVMEIPYSEMSMTQKSVETFVNPAGPLQSVLINNPSIRTSSTSPMYSDFSMRGINMNGNHMMLNGVPSLFYQFAEPHIPGLDYSFSGLKTSFLYNMRKWVEEDPDFIEHHKEDIAASLEWTIVDILMKKLKLAVKQTGIKHVAVAGGVSANNGLRNAFHDHAKRYGWTVYIPKFSYTTDNAAMIGIVGYYKFLDKEFCDINAPAFSKVTFN